MVIGPDCIYSGADLVGRDSRDASGSDGLELGLKLFVRKHKTVRAMRCGGDGLKHRSCQRGQYHGAMWYDSTIPSLNHDAIWVVLCGDASDGYSLKLGLKPDRARRNSSG